MANTITYRGYRLVIHPPSGTTDRWRVLIWPPDEGPPLLIPTHASQENAIQDARNTVDRRLDSATPSSE